MVLVDYIGIFFYMLQYFWQHTVDLYVTCNTRCFSPQTPQMVPCTFRNIDSAIVLSMFML